MTTDPQPHPQFSGRRLTIARVVWVVAVLLYFGTYLVAGRVYLQPSSAADLADRAPSGWTLAEFQAVLGQVGLSPETYARLFAWATFLSAYPFWGISLFIFWRKSSDRMPFIIATCFILLGATPVILGAPLEPLAEANPIWQVMSEALILPPLICLPLIFYLFPSGQFEPRWTRWAYVAWLGLYGLRPLRPLVAGLGPVLDSVTPPVSLGLIATLLIAQVYRYLRISTAPERQQIKWVVGGLSFGTIFVLVISSSSLIFPWLRQPGPIGLVYHFMTNWGQWMVFLFSLPVSFAIAILRSRLWDIDLLIRRTVQYSLLSGLLALVYFGLIVILQGFFTAISGQGSAIATVLSTLAIAALFLPLRRRVQNFIDKRFYRQKYDAQKVLAEFAATARDETDLDTLTTRLVEVVQETMQPERVTLWLKKTDSHNSRGLR